MRTTLIVAALFGLVLARPDIGLELRKQQLHTSYGVPVESVTGLPPIHHQYVTPSPTFETPSVSTVVPFYSGQSVAVAPTVHPVIYDQSFVTHYSSQPLYHQVSVHPAQVQKHVYFYEAPEEPEDIHPKITPTAPPAKKNVKIIFIKAPTYKFAPFVQPLYPQQEEKTLVYVLVKKPDEQQQIVVEPPPPTPPTKPEVFFIKYKNQAEAEEKVQDTLNTHAESGANVITNHVETAPIAGGLPFVTTPSPIITNYVSSTPIPFDNPTGVSFSSNGISGHYVSPTESPLVTSTYGTPIISSSVVSSTESPVISSSYYPSIDANKIVDSYNAPVHSFPHQTYGIPSKKK